MSLELTGVHGLLKRHKLFTHKLFRIAIYFKTVKIKQQIYFASVYICCHPFKYKHVEHRGLNSYHWQYTIFIQSQDDHQCCYSYSQAKVLHMFQALYSKRLSLHPSQPQIQTRYLNITKPFSNIGQDILKVHDQLTENNCCHACMKSTGKYWIHILK